MSPTTGWETPSIAVSSLTLPVVLPTLAFDLTPSACCLMTRPRPGLQEHLSFGERFPEGLACGGSRDYGCYIPVAPQGGQRSDHVVRQPSPMSRGNGDRYITTRTCRRDRPRHQAPNGQWVPIGGPKIAHRGCSVCEVLGLSPDGAERPQGTRSTRTCQNTARRWHIRRHTATSAVRHRADGIDHRIHSGGRQDPRHDLRAAHSSARSA